MAITCTPQSLLESSACFSCIPKGIQQQVMIYLLAQIAEESTDAATLVAAAKCMSCIPHDLRNEIITNLICTIKNTTVTTDYLIQSKGGDYFLLDDGGRIVIN